jgi:hypothetical protein
MPKWGMHGPKPAKKKAFPSMAAKEREDPNPFLAPHAPPRHIPPDVKALLHDDEPIATIIDEMMVYLYDHYWANTRMQSRYYAPLLREQPELTIPVEWLKALAILVYDGTTSNIRRVAECTGVSITDIKRWIEHDRDFREAWNNAHLAGTARVEERVVARARTKDVKDRASMLAATVILNAKAPQVYRPNAPLPPPDLPADFALTDAENPYLKLKAGEVQPGPPPLDAVPALPSGQIIEGELVNASEG